jgi:hypothetical protein
MIQMINQLEYVEVKGLCVSDASVDSEIELTSVAYTCNDVHPYKLSSYSSSMSKAFDEPTSSSIVSSADNALIHINDPLITGKQLNVLACSILPLKLC